MSAWLQTITGRAFVYAEPVVTTEHLKTEVAPILASLPRFGGHTNARYSVAQHSALCATAALDLHDDMELAAFCLLHDAHETWTGDIVSPMQAALVEELALGAQVDPTAVQMVAQARAAHLKLCFKSIQKRIDAAVFAAAGLDPSRYDAHAQRIKDIDVRALRTERDELKARPPQPWDAPIETVQPLPLPGGTLRQMSEADARRLFLDLLHALCPALQLEAA
jgi:hypothetical protein